MANTTQVTPHKHLLVYPVAENENVGSFEDYAEQVESWPGMYFELDGSFVWVPDASSSKSDSEFTAPVERQQIDGMVYDRNGRIEYLDLKGQATIENWLMLVEPILNGENGCQQFLERMREGHLESQFAKSPSAEFPSIDEALHPLVRIYDVEKQQYLAPSQIFGLP